MSEYSIYGKYFDVFSVPYANGWDTQRTVRPVCECVCQHVHIITQFVWVCVCVCV